tara:strand:- start:207 stop:482 length:276 start_codon:yes stop_codon:yes gene_type:complete
VGLEAVTEAVTGVGLEVAMVVDIEIITNLRAYLTLVSITRIQGHRLEVVTEVVMVVVMVVVMAVVTVCLRIFRTIEDHGKNFWRETSNKRR